MPNRYSAKPRFGLILEARLTGFGLCGCHRPRCEEMAFHGFGLIREGGFGTWHGVLVNAPHLELCSLLRLNLASVFSLALEYSTLFSLVSSGKGHASGGKASPNGKGDGVAGRRKRMPRLSPTCTLFGMPPRAMTAECGHPRPLQCPNCCARCSIRLHLARSRCCARGRAHSGRSRTAKPSPARGFSRGMRTMLLLHG